MQRGRGGMDDFFGFGNGGPFAGFGSFGRPGSLITSLLDVRDPFDDPFFTNPFGSMFGSSMFGASPFGSLARPFGQLQNAEYLEEQALPPKKSNGPIIREITSEGEEDDVGGHDSGRGKKEGSRKHSRPSKEPYVEDPDEEVDGRRKKQVHHVNDFSSSSRWQPQAHAYTFQSTKVAYGGRNGAYYTSSITRKTGGDGVTFEESKEADTTTGKAAHRISRGLHDKAHSMTRRLNSDGRVDTMQTLHNLNQDELPGFEKEWKGNAKKHIPGWNRGLDKIENGYERGQISSSGSGRRGGQGWALPSTATATENPQLEDRRTKDTSFESFL